MSRFPFRSLVAALALAGAGMANADIIFTPGNNPEPGEEIINLDPNTDPLTNTVTGHTVQSNLEVFFTGTETLQAGAGGQARVEAVDGSFTNLTFGLTGGTFGDFIFNADIFRPQGPGGQLEGNILVTVNEVGTAIDSTYNFAVSSAGQNFLTITTANGQRIETINISSNVPLAFADLSQPRISGVATCPPGSTDPLCVGPTPGVPEPGMLSLIGVALAGFGATRLRRRKTA
jgi:hypothetical protein